MHKVLFITLIISMQLYAITSILPAEITTDTTLSDTIYINETAQVDSGVTVSVEPGTVFLAEEGASFIFGMSTLLAIGTVDNPIIFTAKDTAKGWGGISIYGTPNRLTSQDITKEGSDISVRGYNRVASSQISHVVIKHSKSSLALRVSYVAIEMERVTISDCGGGGMWSLESDVELKNCAFRRCSGSEALRVSDAINGETLFSMLSTEFSSNEAGAILSQQGRLSLVNCGILQNGSDTSDAGALVINGGICIIDSSTISNNKTADAGGAFLISMGANLTIENSNIVANSAKKEGGAIRALFSTYSLKNVFVTNNSSPKGGAISSQYGRVVIERSTLAANNADSGAALYTLGDTINILNSEVIQNSGAQAIRFFPLATGTPALIANCNIVNNDLGLDFPNEYPLRLVNSILWGNTNGSFKPLTIPLLQANLLVEELTEEDPLFEDPVNNKYNLLEGSMAIDAGTLEFSSIDIGEFDLAGKKRISGTSVDIGAFEFQQSTGISSNLIDKENAKVDIMPGSILVQGLELKDAELAIYTLKGQLLYKKQIHVNRRVSIPTLSTGCYLLSITQNQDQVLSEVFRIN